MKESEPYVTGLRAFATMSEMVVWGKYSLRHKRDTYNCWSLIMETVISFYLNWGNLFSSSWCLAWKQNNPRMWSLCQKVRRQKKKYESSSEHETLPLILKTWTFFKQPIKRWNGVSPFTGSLIISWKSSREKDKINLPWKVCYFPPWWRWRKGCVQDSKPFQQRHTQNAKA